MGYAEKNLAPGESVLYRARYHWVIYRSAILLGSVAIVFAIAAAFAHSHAWEGFPVLLVVAGLLAVLALASFGSRWVRARADEFVVTSRRVMRRVGVLSREIEHAPIEKIQDITVEQGWIGRLLDFGTVVLETASERGTLVFPEIAAPERFRNAIWGIAPTRSGSAGAPPVPPRERLAQLETLRQQGLVTDEEYSAKRREILANL